MKKVIYLIKSIFFLGLFFISSISTAQNDTIVKSKSEFWRKAQFGGGVGLNIGNGFTNIALSPMIYYPVNNTITVGTGLNGSYIKNRDFYKSWVYGGSAILIANPIEFLQLSSELEQLRVNIDYGNSKDNFWNTALFLGAGYRSDNFTIGVRYNVLHKNTNNIYTDPWMPFVRVIF